MRFNAQLSRPEQYIGPGGFHSSCEDIVISTLLGSCISVALFDLSVPVGGINHFMLPQSRAATIDGESSKYGVNAMEILINDILKKGGSKRKLRAKVFGGSTVISLKTEAVFNVPKMNINFAFGFLDVERIPVDAYSVGGALARKIYFFPVSARVLMRYSGSRASGLIHREAVYSNRLLEQAENAGRPVIF